MEVLSSRVLLHPVEVERSRAFYRDTLGLAVYREFEGGIVFFLGGGFLELSRQATTAPGPNVALWLQVRDVDAAHEELLAAGVEILRAPETEPWGLREMWVADPDGVRVAVVEVPEGHPLRSR